jgi:hypothetical protein
VGFEHEAQLFDKAKTIHASDRATTEIGRNQQMVRVKLFALLLGIWEVLGSSFITGTDDFHGFRWILEKNSGIPSITPLETPFAHFPIHYLPVITATEIGWALK